MSQAAALGSVLLGVMVLNGWLWHVDLLRGRHPYPGVMLPSTALLFILAGISLWLQIAEPVSRIRRRIARSLAGLLLVAGVAYLGEYVLGWNLGIDLLWFRSELLAIGAPHPGRLAPQTAWNFILTGLALMTLDVRWQDRPSFSEPLAALIAVIPYFAILGFAYRVPLLYRISPFIEIAFYTALAFSLLAMGILLARPDRGWMARYNRETPGGSILRRLLPAAIVAPPLLGWVRFLGEMRGYYGTAEGIALMVFAMTIGTVGLIMASAAQLDRVDAERRSAQEAEQAAAREIHDLYNHAPTGYHSLDRDGTIIRINDTELAWLGYTREEVIGKLRFSDILLPESQQRFARSFPVFRARGHMEDLEYELRRKDGSILPVLISATAVLDANGRYVMSRSTVFDISRRRQAEEALRESQRALEEAQRIAHLGSWSWDIVRDAVTRSDEVCRIFGAKPGSKTLQGALEALLPADRDSVLHAINQSLYHHEPFSLEMRVGHPDGTVRAIHAQAEVEYGDSDLPLRMVGTVQDITELKAAEAEIAKRTAELNQARQLAQLKDHFLSTISHEMKTPLSLISGYAELLEDRYPGDELLAGLQDGTRRLTRQINNLVDYCALLSGSLPLFQAEVNLAELILPFVRGDARESWLGDRPLQIDIDPGTPPVLGDAHRLFQALGELLENARKFTPPTGRIGIRVAPSGDCVRVDVWDTGRGIPEADRQSVWDAFSRRDVKDAMGKGGLGLGLAIVKKIIELHGGRVELQTRVGEGSCFSLFLPALVPGHPAHGQQEHGSGA
ncbi:MAG TPA: PAS domain-containing sensor histidine kinase [Pantanalinema sp.]